MKSVVLVAAVLACASVLGDVTASDQLDELDRQEMRAYIAKAEQCLQAGDLDCASRQLQQAAKFATSTSERQDIRTRLARVEYARQEALVADVRAASAQDAASLEAWRQDVQYENDAQARSEMAQARRQLAAAQRAAPPPAPTVNPIAAGIASGLAEGRQERQRIDAIHDRGRQALAQAQREEQRRRDAMRRTEPPPPRREPPPPPSANRTSSTAAAAAPTPAPTAKAPEAPAAPRASATRVQGPLPGMASAEATPSTTGTAAGKGASPLSRAGTIASTPNAAPPADATTPNATTTTAQAETPLKQALAFCWQNKSRERWFCDGKTQELMIAEEDLDEQLRMSGCKDPVRIGNGERTLTHDRNGPRSGRLYRCSDVITAGNSGKLTWNRDIRGWWSGLDDF